MKHLKIALLGIGTALILSSVSFATAAQSKRDWPQWMSHYYQLPEADKVVTAVFALSRDGYFETAGQPATAIGFLSGVFAQNPEKVPGWISDFRNLPVAHQRLVAAALWYSGLPGGDRQLRALALNSSQEMRQEVDQMLARGGPTVNDTPVLSEASLDLQWGAFLATGEEKHIVNALAALGSGEAGLSAAARLALAEKAASHPRVYEICQAQLAHQPTNVRDQMQTALASVKRQP